MSEELSATAEELSSQAETLRDAISYFRFEEAGDALATSSKEAPSAKRTGLAIIS